MRTKQIYFRLAALALGLAPFLVLEVALRLWQPWGAANVLDPLVGFSEVSDLFELDKSTQTYRTARGRQILFGRETFAAVKPADTFRVFCLGGSTVRGRPFHLETAFPHWLSMELAEADNTRQYEVINCGGLSYASYRLRLILQEVLRYDPDLIVLAMGHNEFLEDRTYRQQKSRSGIWAWLEDRSAQLRIVQTARSLTGKTQPLATTTLGAEVTPKLDSESGYASYQRDSDWQVEVQDHFAWCLADMLQTGQQANVPMAVVNLGSNLRDTVPFKSAHRRKLSAAEEQAWQQAMLTGEAAEASAEVALAAYQMAAQIDDGHALLCFRIASCFDRLGMYAEASRYYQQAKEQDICPLRMLNDTAQAVRETCLERAVPCLEFGQAIDDRSAQGIPGNDWYMDHVHPSVMGHQLLAEQLAQLIQDQNWWPGKREQASQDRRRTFAKTYLAELPLSYFPNGRERLSWLQNWARHERLAEAFDAHDGNRQLRLGLLNWQFGSAADAWPDLDRALESSTQHIDSLLDFAHRLTTYGHHGQASLLLQGLSTRTDGADRARILRARYVVAVDAGDQVKAFALLKRYPDALATPPAKRWQALLPQETVTPVDAID